LLLKAKLKNVGEWKAVLNAVGNIAEDAMFLCNDNGISFRGIDPSHVSLLDVTFPKSSFDEFVCQNSFFGIKVDDFKMVMNTASNSDSVEIEIENETTMRVSIKGNFFMEYNIRLIQRQEVNTPIPKIAYKSKISIDSNLLSQIFSNIEKISEFVTIQCNSEEVKFSGEGDIGDAKIKIEKGNPDLKEILSTEISSAVYSLEYMAKVIRDIGRASKVVNMEYADKNPIRILFEMPSKARVEYYLAPRVEN